MQEMLIPPLHQMQMEAGKTGKKHPKKAIFVHSALDQVGLDVYEFRLLGHIARRGSCFASLATTADLCKMSVRKAQSTLKSLEKRGFIEKKQRLGRTDVYKLAPDLLYKLQPNLDIPVSDENNELRLDPEDEPLPTRKDLEDMPF
jgi:hypothetical protein